MTRLNKSATLFKKKKRFNRFLRVELAFCRTPKTLLKLICKNADFASIGDFWGRRRNLF